MDKEELKLLRERLTLCGFSVQEVNEICNDPFTAKIFYNAWLKTQDDLWVMYNTPYTEDNYDEETVSDLIG